MNTTQNKGIAAWVPDRVPEGSDSGHFTSV